MRDEARAKRLSDTVSRPHSVLTSPYLRFQIPCFNLQTQYEKIKRFEETLGRCCLFPNVLAAKWRDIYDNERKKAFMEQTRSPGSDGIEGQACAHTDLGR